MSELTITRGALKKLARDVLKNRSQITREQRKKITETAATADAVVLNGWRLRGCGCLIGASYPEFFRVDGEWRTEAARDSTTDPLGFVGLDFNTLLCAHLDSTGQSYSGQSYSGDRRAIVKVIDNV